MTVSSPSAPRLTADLGHRSNSVGTESGAGAWRRPVASLVVLVGGIAMVLLAATRGALIEVLLTAGIVLTVAGLIDQRRVTRPRPRFLSAGVALLYVAISAKTLFRQGDPPAFLATGADFGVLFIAWGLIAGALDVAAMRGRRLLRSQPPS